MPDTVSSLSSTPGVLFTPPPDKLLPSIMDSINSAIASLPPGSKGALVAIADDKGANAAIVTRLNDPIMGLEWGVSAWIGKTWAEPSIKYGVAVKTTW